MRWIVCWMAATLAAQAGVVKGVVLEHISGLALARSQVRLQPIPSAEGKVAAPRQMMAGPTGQFTFLNVPPGLYLVVASRDNYFPAAWGQRRPDGQGTPIAVTGDSDFFAELRMRRKGAIAGRVLDENGVGMARVPVVAYRARLPLRTAGRAVSDERGVYRIHGLEPGKYWVRNGTFTVEDGTGRLPVFSPESREPREARVFRVQLDEDTPDANMRPEPGRLARLDGAISCGTPAPVAVTLSSETGRLTTQGMCPGGFSFASLFPSAYEVFVMTLSGDQAGFTETLVNPDRTTSGVQMFAPAPVEFDLRVGAAPAPRGLPVKLLGRRVDPSEAEPLTTIPLPRAPLAPGNWEFAVEAGTGYYVESISGPQSRRSSLTRPADWYAIFVDGRFTRVRITLGDKPARISGAVTHEQRKIPGAPVFLWPASEAARRSLNGWVKTLTDAEGRYRFEDLPPGDYRLLATFDVSDVDDELMEEARAQAVRTEPSKAVSADLSLWLAP